MFQKFFVLTAAIFILLLAATSWMTPRATAARAQATDPVSIVKAYYAAYNAGEIEKAVAYLSNNIVFVNPTGTYLGVDKARENLEALKKDGLTFELSNFKNENGRVVYSYKVIIGGASVETGDGGLSIVRGDKIVFDGTTNTEKEWAPGVVKAYYDAYNAGDIDLAVSFLADEVVFVNPTGTYQGQDAARANLEAIKKDGISFDIFDLKNTNGRVVYSYKVNIGGETVETGDGGLTKVLNGLIVFDGTTETETQLPTTGADFSMNALWFALAGVMLAGVGVLLLKKMRVG